MLRYHVAAHLPRAAGEVVVAETFDFPGASAIEDLAQCLLEEGKTLPVAQSAAVPCAFRIELVPLKPGGKPGE